MVRKISFIILGIASIAAGIALLLSARAYLVKKSTVPFTPQLPSFQFKVPTQAIDGQITNPVGDVVKIARDSTISAQVKTGDSFLPAETLTTHGKSAATITFGDNGVVTLSPWSEVIYSDGIPSSLLLIQDQGTVRYTTSSSSPLQIRIWHALISTVNGSVRITLNTTRHTASVLVLSGSASMAMIDKTNQTRVLSLTEKQTGQINDTTRLMNLVSPLKKSVKLR